MRLDRDQSYLNLASMVELLGVLRNPLASKLEALHNLWVAHRNLRVALQNSLVLEVMAADSKDPLEAIATSKVVVHTSARASFATNTANLDHWQGFDVPCIFQKNYIIYDKFTN